MMSNNWNLNEQLECQKPQAGGAEKTKAVLGMMHKTQEPDPACPCSPTSWPAGPQACEDGWG